MASRTPPYSIELLIEFRRKHPTWGARKLIAALQVMHPMVEFPAASTANELLRRHGLIREQRRERRWTRQHSVEMRQLAGPNSTWAIDFKGQFRFRNGGWCYPLTITDLASRKIIRCTALRSTELEACWSVIESAFREFGLPYVIRSDNGTPFRAPRSELGLSVLAIRFIELGVDVEYIERGKPQQNGSHERMHRTLQADCLRKPADDLEAQQAAFDAFVREFNSERPHDALALQTPDAVYAPSARCRVSCLDRYTRATCRRGWSMPTGASPGAERTSSAAP
jgi:transposase InsO family protein